ncbi:hypothetical protein EGR_00748 [Echinococcus granulosus]|uniref:Uncharacterized protein n=1 Tax=Echinococcus granulosus TaxID=6210 RepID=W6VBJ7_ECHGR|nr:hypothetical protein EGR_00748 [Echinococcus granulosus]EUB64204.1 hypothetical protein EGR_00748 [Echinococcus granulosus]
MEIRRLQAIIHLVPPYIVQNKQTESLTAKKMHSFHFGRYQHILPFCPNYPRVQEESLVKWRRNKCLNGMAQEGQNRVSPFLAKKKNIINLKFANILNSRLKCQVLLKIDETHFVALIAKTTFFKYTVL